MGYENWAKITDIKYKKNFAKMRPFEIIIKYSNNQRTDIRIYNNAEIGIFDSFVIYNTYTPFTHVIRYTAYSYIYNCRSDVYKHEYLMNSIGIYRYICKYYGIDYPKYFYKMFTPRISSDDQYDKPLQLNNIKYYHGLIMPCSSVNKKEKCIELEFTC